MFPDEFDNEGTPMGGGSGFAIDKSSLERNGNELTIKVFSFANVPFPSELMIEGEKWIFGGNGFLTMEESNTFFAKAIYKHKMSPVRPRGPFIG